MVMQTTDVENHYYYPFPICCSRGCGMCILIVPWPLIDSSTVDKLLHFSDVHYAGCQDVWTANVNLNVGAGTWVDHHYNQAVEKGWKPHWPHHKASPLGLGLSYWGQRDTWTPGKLAAVPADVAQPSSHRACLCAHLTRWPFQLTVWSFPVSLYLCRCAVPRVLWQHLVH